MHRRLLLDLLDRYESVHPGELARIDQVRRFVREHRDCFERTCLAAHVTGSAFVLSPDHRSVLLTHHAKLGRWLQLGGHADGEADPFAVALREAREESGLRDFALLVEERAPLPLDVDVHEIPARPDEPPHLHLDIRYLLVAAPGQSPVRSEESRDLRWIERARLAEYSSDPSLLRLEAKTRLRIARLAAAPSSGRDLLSRRSG
jgi:8-oxo-dGTP pyrophosphatase MutT (NUDIX family)